MSIGLEISLFDFKLLPDGKLLSVILQRYFLSDESKINDIKTASR